MFYHRLRLVAVLFALFAVLLSACGPQATPTPEPTEEAVEATEEAVVEATEEAVVEATEEAVEATEEAVVEATEEAVVEATEEAVVEATEEAIEATEEAVVEATEEAVVEATEEAVVEATEEAVVEATEEAVVEATEVAVEATEEAVVEATEVAVEATEEAVVEATEEAPAELVTFEGATFTFSYPSSFEAQGGGASEVVRLTSGDQAVIVMGPAAYNAVLAGKEFTSDAEQLAYFLDRVGYTVGEEHANGGLASVNVALPRRNSVGFATLLDVEEGRRAVVIELGPDAESLPTSASAAVIESLVFPPAPVEEEAAAEEPAAAAPNLTIVGLAVGNENLSTLATAVVRGGLISTLNGEGPFTVFAPTNDAFTAALEALSLSADDLFANQELLTGVLTYHVVEGSLTSDVLQSGELTTVNGAVLTVAVSDGAVTVTDGQGNTYNVVTADVLARNGVVHVIDGVLLPPSGE